MTEDTLVFLPGFMGHTSDFAPLADALAAESGLQSDRAPWTWPAAQPDESFMCYSQRIWQDVSARWPSSFYVYAYSMGGRMALSWLDRDDFRARCRGIFIASAHPGLRTEPERQDRAKHDEQWVQAFAQQPLEDVLRRWYEQPVFQSLTIGERQIQSAAKGHGHGTDYAGILHSASLAGQPDLRSAFQRFPKAAYVVGDQDTKFHTLAQTFCPTESLICIPNAGHLVHAEQPTALAKQIRQQLSDWRTQHD